MNFSRALRIARAARGYSLETLSWTTGIQPIQLLSLECGRKEPLEEESLALARALGLPHQLLTLLAETPEALQQIPGPELDAMARLLLEHLVKPAD